MQPTCRIIARLDPRVRIQTTPLSAILNSELDAAITLRSE